VPARSGPPPDAPPRLRCGPCRRRHRPVRGDA
jgi:hypothetical protein